jgi:hypothetical protein
VAARNPSAWSDHLSWIEYAHNSMSCAATGMSQFKCSLGYQPPLFPAQEDDISVPSVQHHLRRCRRVWKGARTALLHSAEHNRRIADRSRSCRVGQQVWLSSKNLPLQTASKKLSPRFVGPFPIVSVINTSAVTLKLPPAMHVHPTFHVSRLKPVSVSSLSPPAVPVPSLFD